MKPRSPVANPHLTRPNWLKDAPRNPKLLWLDKNENPDPELLEVTKGVLRQIDEVYLYTYPEMAALYQKLGNCEDLPPESLILTAGSDGAIRQVFEALISEGDTVLHTTPTFAMYPIYSMIYGAKPVTVEYLPAGNQPTPFIPVDTLLKALHDHQPQLFCLPNPDSPTGSVFGPSELNALIQKAREVDSWVLIDEAYFPFYPQSIAHRAATDPNYSHVIVARTFSKAWGLAGLRTGYAVACPETSQLLHKVRPMYEINTLAAGFIEQMLDHKKEVLRSVGRLTAGKTFFNAEMENLGFRVLKGEGNFTHVAFGTKQSAVFNALEDLVLFRKDFKDPCLQGFSRFSAGPQPMMKQVSDRIRSAIQ